MASLNCCVVTARRLPGGTHSAQPKHLSFLHFVVQGLVFFAHEGLQSPGVVVVTEVAVNAVVVVAEAVMHGEHPLQQSHEHLNDQLSELCAQKGLHSLVEVVVGVVVDGGVVIVVDVDGASVVVDGAGVVVDGDGVGESPGMH